MLMLSDEQIDRIIAKQAWMIENRFEELIKQLPEEAQQTYRCALQLQDALKIPLGAALNLSFWFLELQEMGKDVIAPANKERALHLGRLIKIGGGMKAVNHAISIFPEDSQKYLKELWKDLKKWKSRDRLSNCNYKIRPQSFESDFVD